MSDDKREFLWDWFRQEEQTFTIDEVHELCEKIKVFNAGAIDAYLTNHVNKTVDEWLEEKKA